MVINFEWVEASRTIVTHHGPGPTCIRLAYVQTKPGKDGNGSSSPLLFYYAKVSCFAEDGQTVEFPFLYMRDQMRDKNYKKRGFNASNELVCHDGFSPKNC